MSPRTFTTFPFAELQARSILLEACAIPAHGKPPSAYQPHGRKKQIDRGSSSTFPTPDEQVQASTMRSDTGRHTFSEMSGILVD